MKRNDLREIPGAVEEIRLADVQARIEPGSPTRIITPAIRWSYAAALPLAFPSNAAGEFWVRIRARVLLGQAGFGLLNRAGSAFLDRSFVVSGNETVVLFLQIADPADAQSLIIQNATPDGQAAEILLEEVTVLGPPGS